MERVNIDDRYPAHMEIRQDDAEYLAFYNTLSATFTGMQGLNSFCDVGCATGHLIKLVKLNHPEVAVAGLEYFQYHKDSASSLIRDNIHICDLRDDICDPVIKAERHLDLPTYDLVVCTEVGERIDRAYESRLLKNIRSLMHEKSQLVMSWSETGGVNDKESDPYHQHLNPLNRKTFERMMTFNGFKLLNDRSMAMVISSFEEEKFSHWSRSSLSVWCIDSSFKYFGDTATYSQYNALMNLVAKDGFNPEAASLIFKGNVNK